MPFTLDPDLGEALGKLFGNQPPPAPLPVGDVKGRRERVGGLFQALFASAPEVTDVDSKEFFTKAEDGHQIKLVWYSKGKSSSSGPAVCYIHGGGMISLGLEHYDVPMKTYVSHLGIPFLFVDYRLAPEVQAPVPVTDSYAGLKWLVDHAGDLGVDPARIALMGDSAGGGIAASLTYLLKQKGGPSISKQVLIYPMLDDRNTKPDEDTAAFATWTFDDNKTGWGALLGDKAGSKDVPAIHAAARATVAEAKGLPPTYIDVGELDIFRDEDLDYARTLGKAGVSVEFHLYPGVPHAFEAFAPQSKVATKAIGNRLAFLSTL